MGNDWEPWALETLRKKPHPSLRKFSPQVISFATEATDSIQNTTSGNVLL